MLDVSGLAPQQAYAQGYLDCIEELIELFEDQLAMGNGIKTASSEVVQLLMDRRKELTQ